MIKYFICLIFPIFLKNYTYQDRVKKIETIFSEYNYWIIDDYLREIAI